jgi:hypothetical protein
MFERAGININELSTNVGRFSKTSQLTTLSSCHAKASTDKRTDRIAKQKNTSISYV